MERYRSPSRYALRRFAAFPPESLQFLQKPCAGFHGLPTGAAHAVGLAAQDAFRGAAVDKDLGGVDLFLEVFVFIHDVGKGFLGGVFPAISDEAAGRHHDKINQVVDLRLYRIVARPHGKGQQYKEKYQKGDLFHGNAPVEEPAGNCCYRLKRCRHAFPGLLTRPDGPRGTAAGGVSCICHRDRNASPPSTAPLSARLWMPFCL